MMKNFLEAVVFGGHPVCADRVIIMMASVEVVIMASEVTYHVAFTLDEQNVETMTNKLQGEIAVQAAIIGIIITI